MGRPKGTNNKAKKELPIFTVKLSINGQVYESSSDALDTAILGLPKITPKTTANLIIAKGGKDSKPIYFNMNAFKRLFYPGMTGKVNRLALEKRFAFYA